MTPKTGFVWAEQYAWHDTGTAVSSMPTGGSLEPDLHVESPISKRRFRNLLEIAGLWDQLALLKARHAEETEILRFHDPAYIEMLKTASAGRGGDGGEEVPFGHGGYDIARLSAGGCMVALDAVMNETVRYTYALVRPPGHHAEAARGRGFCMLANIVLAIHHARAHYGVERVAVFDWDVHHGNGTETAFYDDPGVLAISVHQSNNYPQGGGALEDRGEGAGFGTTINIPLPPGSGHGAYVETVERVVIPACQRYQPDLIIIASGFDASAMDPLGRMMCTSETYRAMTESLMRVAADVCQNRLMLCHEGGYSAQYVPFCGLAVMEALSGIHTGVIDPFLEHLGNMDGHAVQPHQRAVIDAAAALAADVPTR